MSNLFQLLGLNSIVNCGVWNSFDSEVSSPFDVMYNGSNWLIPGNYSKFSGPASNPDTTWSTISGSDNSDGYWCLEYGNGYWISSGRYGSKSYLNSSDPDGTWTTVASGFGTYTTDIEYSGSSWFAISDNGSSNSYGINNSSPTGTWSTNNVTGNSVHYNGSYWCTVGDSGSSHYLSGSDPTQSWTSQTIDTSDLESVYYGNGYWVAVGFDGLIYLNNSSPVGTWSDSSLTNHLTDIYYNGTIWTAVGTNGGIYTTSDGNPTTGWTSETITTSDDFKSVYYGNGYWVAVGESDLSYYKKDCT